MGRQDTVKAVGRVKRGLTPGFTAVKSERLADDRLYRLIRQGLTKANILKRGEEYEKIALEQRRMGGEISQEVMDEVKSMCELSGKPMRPVFMSIGDINRELRSLNIAPKRKEVLKRALAEREEAP